MFGPPGKLWVAHRVSTTEHHKHNQRAHDNIPREMKVSRGCGAMGCGTMAIETVTMNVTEQVVPSRQTTRRGDRRPQAADPDADGDRTAKVPSHRQ